MVILNDTVKVITDLSFKGCTALTRIIIPNSVTKIGWWAFMNCTVLASISIPNSVEFLDAETFSGCSAFTDISIPSSVTKIRGSLFCDCTALASISIPNSVTEIGNWAFSGCTALVSIKVDPANPRFDSRGDCNAIIETITNELIAGCKSSIIPNSVKEIGTSVFEGCTGLTSIIVPDSVVYIHRDAFYNCTSLTNVSLSLTNCGIFWLAISRIIWVCGARRPLLMMTTLLPAPRIFFVRKSIGRIYNMIITWRFWNLRKTRMMIPRADACNP